MTVLLISFYVWMQILVGEPLPIGQVQISNFTPIYAAPVYSFPIDRARSGDILWIYEVVGDWGRTDTGWLLLPQPLQPAVVSSTAILDQTIDITPAYGDAPSERIRRQTEVGVLAIIDDQALLYTRQQVGWVTLANADLIWSDPSPNFADFVENVGYVQVEQTPLYETPDLNAETFGTLRLGKQVRIVHQVDEWGLVIADSMYGWVQLADFDQLPRGYARGTMTAGDVNFRSAPTTNSRILTVLAYQAPILILGRSQNESWFHIRSNGVDGWVSAQFVELDDGSVVVADLPVFD